MQQVSACVNLETMEINWSLFIDIVVYGLQGLFFVRLIYSILTRTSDYNKPNTTNPILLFIYELTDPILTRVRKILPKSNLIDLSYFLIILALEVLGSVLKALL
ncbi:YggT family protein [Candidatus Saccharibacteria bacterium]|nr:YggT family protein [Candidatus Saccharibacteria bacterium]MCB9834984.1 YggT family protein [Candidatus Nomurabacteria bacterium]